MFILPLFYSAYEYILFNLSQVLQIFILVKYAKLWT